MKRSPEIGSRKSSRSRKRQMFPACGDARFSLTVVGNCDDDDLGRHADGRQIEGRLF